MAEFRDQSVCLFRSAGVRVAVLLAAFACASLGGCTTFQSREAGLAYSPAIPLDESDWPARRTDRLSEIASGSPREVFNIVSNGRFAAGDVPPAIERMLGRPMGRAPYSGVHGKGVLRVSPGREGGLSMRFYSYSLREDRPIDSRLTEYAQRQVRGWEERRAAEAEKRQKAEADGETPPSTDSPNAPPSPAVAHRAADQDLLRLLPEGTSIRVSPPTGDVPARGSVVYMSGLGSIEYEQPIVDELRRRGWWIIRVSTPRVWWYESQPWHIPSMEEVPRIAQTLAGVLDDLIAEPAYAAEAALDYIATHRKDIPLGPLVMVGCSAGALAAPTVVARMPEKFEAAVLVGGGANLLEISQNSDLTDGGIRLAWPNDKPRGDWRDRLFRDYLEASKLDPAHTAHFLRDKPTLVVTANLDMTVPASNGWLLWENLGRPDRYVHVGEHRTLFYTLKGQSNRIADWIDRAMSKRHLREAMATQSPASSGATHNSPSH